eukprot:gene7285-7498_t
MGVSRHLVLSLLAVALKAAIAHPQYFLDGYANGCTDHPTTALGRHKAPEPDKTTIFKITTAAGAASTAVCPGTAYKVSVDYGTNTRETYITASTGSFATAPKKECPGATVGSERTSVFVDTLTLPCTATATTVDSNRLAAADITGGAQPVHFLLDSPAPGYAGLAFPVTAGRMSPADAVIGYVDPATGKPTVSAYGLTNYVVDLSNSNFNSRGWAKNMGVARPAGKFFSKYAGGHSGISCRRSKLLVVMVVYVGRVREGEGGGEGHKGGRGVQLLAVLLALAGFIMAVVAFKVSWSLDAPTPHSLYNPHRFIGVVVMGLVLMQVRGAGAAASNAAAVLWFLVVLLLLMALTGFLRPKMGARNRQPWRFGHLSLGWLSMALGLVVVFLGVVLMHDLKSRPWVDWLLPVVLLLGLLLLAGVVGEVLKTRLESRGRYKPRTHEFGDSLALTGDDVLKPKAAHAASAGTGNGTNGSTPFESRAADNGSANGNAGKAQLLTGQPSV